MQAYPTQALYQLYSISQIIPWCDTSCFLIRNHIILDKSATVISSSQFFELSTAFFSVSFSSSVNGREEFSMIHLQRNLICSSVMTILHLPFLYSNTCLNEVLIILCTSNKHRNLLFVYHHNYIELQPCQAFPLGNSFRIWAFHSCF